MKKLYAFYIALFFFTTTAQSCLPEGIVFTNQSQIDQFQINYPNCTEIEGDVVIGFWLGTNITNLNGLSILTTLVKPLPRCTAVSCQNRNARKFLFDARKGDLVLFCLVAQYV